MRTRACRRSWCFVYAIHQQCSNSNCKKIRPLFRVSRPALPPTKNNSPLCVGYTCVLIQGTLQQSDWFSPTERYEHSLTEIPRIFTRQCEDVHIAQFLGCIACRQCKKMRGLLPQMSHVAWSVCLSVCVLVYGCPVQKRLNRSRARLGGWLMWVHGTMFCSVLFFSRPRSESWPHHGRIFSSYLCPLSFWLTLLGEVLATYWCCPSMSCVVRGLPCLSCLRAHDVVPCIISFSRQLPCFLMVWP